MSLHLIMGYTLGYIVHMQKCGEISPDGAAVIAATAPGLLCECCGRRRDLTAQLLELALLALQKVVVQPQLLGNTLRCQKVHVLRFCEKLTHLTRSLFLKARRQ